jgi:hypothetical protein
MAKKSVFKEEKQEFVITTEQTKYKSLLLVVGIIAIIAVCGIILLIVVVMGGEKKNTTGKAYMQNNQIVINYGESVDQLYACGPDLHYLPQHCIPECINGEFACT